MPKVVLTQLNVPLIEVRPPSLVGNAKTKHHILAILSIGQQKLDESEQQKLDESGQQKLDESGQQSLAARTKPCYGLMLPTERL